MNIIRNLSEVLIASGTSGAGITFCEAGKDRFVSYGQLRKAAGALLGQLQERGLGKGQHVVLQTEDNERFLVLFWACLLGGMIPVPLTAGRTDEGRKKLLQVSSQLGNPYLLCEPEIWDSVAAYCLKNEEQAAGQLLQKRMLPIKDVLDEAAAIDRQGTVYAANEDDVAFIQFTSGSTGDPKGVVLTHGNLLSNMRAILEGAQSTEADSSLSWLPLTHDMGLIGFHLTPMLGLMNQWQMPTSTFVLHPMKWMELTHQHRITCLSSPNFGYVHFLQHFKPENATCWDLSSVRLIFNGAEPISASNCREFLAQMKPYGLREQCIFPVYGLAEASLAVTFPHVEESLNTLYVSRKGLNIGDVIQDAPADDPNKIEIVELGFPVSECELKICDESGRETPDRYVGLLHIRGRNVTKGYFNRPDVNAVILSTDGWLNTGDLGFMQDGRLYVTGRMKDIIFVNGQNIYPHDLEMLASEIKGAEIGKVAVSAIQNEVTKQDEIAVFIQFRGKLNAFVPLRQSVQRLLNRKTGLQVELIVPVKRIPKTTSGKIQRYTLAESMQSGQFSSVIAELESLAAIMEETAPESAAAAPETDAEQRILSIWKKVLKTDRIGIDDHFLEHGGNSLSAAYVAAQLQSAFGINVSLSELFQHHTVRLLAAYVAEVTAGEDQRNDRNGQCEVISNGGTRDWYPATSTQKRLFIVEEMNSGLLRYHLPQRISIEGELDLSKFQQVWESLINRHSSLRTSFVMDNDIVVGRITDSVKLPIVYTDGRGWSESDMQHKISTFLQPYELSKAPLFRMELITLSHNRHLMLFDMHHLITDGTSMGILIGQFVAMYEGAELPPIPFQYSDIADWEKRFRAEDRRMIRQREYWRQIFKEGAGEIDIPADYRRPLTPSYKGAIEKFVLDATLTAKLEQLAFRTGGTLYTVLTSVYFMLLSKYTGAVDMVIGTASAGRTRPEMDGIVGLFVNMVPLRLRAGKELSILQCFEEINKQILLSLDHQDVPYEEIVELAEAKQELGRNPLFSTVFTLHNMEIPQFHTANVTFKPEPIGTGTSKFDMTWECIASEEGITVSIEYSLDLYSQETVRGFARHYKTLADAAVQSPETTVEMLPMLDEDECQLILATSESSRAPYPNDASLYRLFERQVDHTPQLPAIVMDEATLSYTELNEMANALARWLINRGVVPHSRVALLLHRSFNMPVAILAVLKTGSAYVPIDPSYPIDRIEFMLGDADISTMIVDAQTSHIGGKLAQAGNRPVDKIDMDAMRNEWRQAEGHNLNVDVTGDDAAYVMYTSGSTGRPKGILTTHRNVIRIARDTDYIRITNEDALLQLSNYAFDGSTFDFYGALLNGAKLVLVNENDLLDIHQLILLMKKQRVTVFFATTALFNAFVDSGLKDLPSLRHLLFGGERASASHIKRAYQIVGSGVLLHVYGPTESTVFATCYPIDSLEQDNAAIPIGKPIAHLEALVLDENGALLPALVPGELCIAGDGLTQGYLNLPELTANKFVPHPFKEGTKLYRTGDLVRRLPDGNLEFLDRLDTQVKLRGFRIELGEIESKLLECEDVREAVVMLKYRSGDPQLAAYIVANGELSIDRLQAELGAKLPQFMIPAVFVRVEKLPLTSNGKINKNALPEPDFSKLSIGMAAAYVPPTTQTEIQLATIWEMVLKVEAVGVNDNFLAHGGHSLKAATLVSEIYKQYHVRMPIKEVFLRSTVREQAEWIDSADIEAYEPIKPINISRSYPLSPSQQRIFLIEEIANAGIAYHIPLALRLTCHVQRTDMERAIKELIALHEPLRTSFQFIDGEARQIIHEHASFELQEISDTTIDLEQQFCEFAKPLPLSQAPLLDARLLSSACGETYLLLNIHHIIADGISVSLLIEELVKRLDGKRLEEPHIQFKDYAVWRSGQGNKERMRKSIRYWETELSDPPSSLDMPLDFPRGERQSLEGETFGFHVPSELAIRLQSISDTLNISLNSLLFASYALLLQKYTSGNDLIIGALAAGRSHPDTANMIGMFNNFLPVRLKIGDGMKFDQFAKASHDHLLAALEHQDVSFDQMIEAAQMMMDPSRNPLFDTMMILHNQVENDLEVKGHTVGVQPVRASKNMTSKLDFKLDLYPHGDGGFRAELEFNTRLFHKATMMRLADHWLNVLKQVADEPGMKCSSLSLIMEKEAQMLLQEWNDTATPYPDGETIHGCFEAQVRKTPNAPAIRSNEGMFTYRELDDRANRLALLLRQKGVGAETIVPIVAERSFEMMAAILGILKAGGAYLPIDPHFPEERIGYIFEDSGAKLLCSQRKWMDQLPFNGEIIDIDAVEDKGSHDTEEWLLEPAVNAHHLAYVIYTSGSTGKPKGVMIEHAAVINRIHWMQDQYPLDSQDVILQKTPITFDVSVWELFWWSFAGASVYLLEPRGEREPQVMMKVIREQAVTVMHFVPSMLGVYLQYASEVKAVNPFGGLRYVFASGEALKPAQVEGFYSQHSAGSESPRLINLYGPTEATVDVSAYDCANYKQGSVPIGSPIQNIRLYVVDEQRRLQPIGIPGELCIAGVGLARGYLNRQELTAEKFVLDPFFAGERMYLTGDRARWLADGHIEYLGRFDHQVKIRGFRMECGEIEHALMQLEEVSDALVMPVKDRTGEPALCAYVVSSFERNDRELKERLRGMLPEYMIPSLFACLHSFPLNASGKIDRSRLPQPIFADSIGGADPRSETELRLAELWKSILGVHIVRTDDHFFQIGGHSLRAAQLTGAVERQLEVIFTLKDVFAYPVLEEMAAFIDRSPKRTAATITRAEQRDVYPLSLAQNRLFVLHHMKPSSTAYNLPFALSMRGELNVERLQEALQRLIDRHEPLRTSFEWRDGAPVQRIHERVMVRADVTKTDQVDGWNSMQKFVQPFDLSIAPLLRASLITNGAQEHLLLLDMHHIVSDGISMTVLAHDFTKLYEGGTLLSLEIQYKDVAVWQQGFMKSRERDRQEQYWREELAGTLPLLDLRVDKPRPAEQSFKGSKIIHALPLSLMSEVESLAATAGMTSFPIWLACFHVLLHKLTGQEDIISGTPIGGRSHLETAPLVGMFVNTVAIRSQPSGEHSFLHFARQIKEKVLGAMHNGMLPFEHCVTALDVKRDLSRNPIFDVMFVMQNMDVPAMKADVLQLKTQPLEHAVSKLDLTFELAMREDGADLTVEYATDLFEQQTINQMISYYIRIVEQITKDTHISLNQISLLTSDEEAIQLVQFNETATAYPIHMTVESYLEAQAEWIPHATALIYETGEMSYRELNGKANRLARVLRKHGVKHEDTVAVIMERSVDMIIAIYGILKAGAAYVPISPGLPEERVRYMLDDSGARIVLTQGLDGQFNNMSLDSKRLNIEEALQHEQNDGPLEKIHRSRSLAYVLYTSGSTGQPKGVMIEHHSVVNRLTWMQNRYTLDMHDVILQKTPFTFDVSVWELFLWSFSGAKLCLLAPGGEKDPGAIYDAINKHEVTTLHFVPSMLHLFLDYPGLVNDSKKLESLRYVFASGEALTVNQVERFRERIGESNAAKLINLYGPTEATVDVSYYECIGEQSLTSVPIGKPIDNISLYVVNDVMQVQPVGVAGELCIAGVGLARGYWKRPDLTSEKFVKNPFAANELMYRTGDLARWLPDGSIEFLGRMDHQVKIRGYRIECGEIEHALTGHPDVREAVVMKRDGAAGESAFLCAYVVTSDAVTTAQLRYHLAKTLPDYMVPAVYVELDQMPLSPNGKVDRKSLPATDERLDEGVHYVEAASETEKTISIVWGEVLGRTAIGTHHNFFDVGGESLLLVRTHQRLEELYPGLLKVTDLFNYPTIAGLAEYIDSQSNLPHIWHYAGIAAGEDSFNNTYTAQRNGSYQFTLEDDLIEGLAEMAYSESVSITTVALAIYLLFWKQQSGANDLVMPVATSRGRLTPLELDFSTVLEFSELIRAADSLFDDTKISYDWNQVERELGSHNSSRITPLFVDRSRTGFIPENQLMHHFDIILTLDSGRGGAGKGMSGLWEFNARRLKKEKVKAWAQGYIKLLRMAVHQFQQTSNARAGGKQ